MNARALVACFVLALGSAFVLWRIDVLPGWWDLTHWGIDVEAEAERARVAHRDARLNGFRSQAAAAQVAAFESGVDQQRPYIVFLGSSTIEFWDLKASFPGVRAVNRGIGDEPAALLMDRLDVAIDWSAVQGVVVYAASVDFRRLNEPPSEVLGRITRVLDAVQERAPGRPILVLGLLSEREIKGTLRQDLTEVNARLKALCAQRNLTFLPTDRAPLTRSDGTLSPAHSADRLHLNADGYQVLSDWIRKEGGPLVPLLFP